MGLVRKIKAGLVKVSVNDFVGEDGNIFFDIDDGVLRLSDGATPGGIPLATGGTEGGASTFRQLLDTPSSFTGAASRFVKVNAQASALEFVDVSLFDGDYNSLTNRPTLFNPSSITTSLVPQTNEAIDLGTSSLKWRDLYLSGSTIYLGNAVIRNIDGTVDLPVNAKVNGKKIPTDIRDLDDVDNLLSGTGVTSYNDLTDKPTLFSGNYNDLTNKPTIPTVPTNISAFTNDAGYLTTIGTISYNDLSNKPTIPTDISDLTDVNNVLAASGAGYILPAATASSLGGIKIGTGLSISESGVVSVTTVGVTSYNDLTDKPDLTVYQLSSTAFSGSYADLTNKPTLFSGAYADLTGLPALFSGSYNDLTDKPTIPTVPTNISAFTNDAGYLTTVGTISYNDLSDRPTLFSGSYNDLTNRPTLFSGAYADLTGTPDLSVYQLTANAFSGSYNDLTNRPTLFSGSYDDLTNKPTLPTDTGDLTNNVGFITLSALTEYATQTYVTSALASAGVTISDTLPTGLFNGALWYNSTDLQMYVLYQDQWISISAAFSGNYNDLSNKPTNLSQFINDRNFVTRDDVYAMILELGL